MKQTIRTTDGKIYTGEVVESLRVEGEEYYFTCFSRVACCKEELFNEEDNYHYNTLNYFKTEEEAEAKRTYDPAVGEVTRRIQELGEGRYDIAYYNKMFHPDRLSDGVVTASTLPLMSEETAQTIIKEYEDTLLPVIFKMKK